MEFLRVSANDFEELKTLQTAYKQEIGEDAPGEDGLEKLRKAVAGGEIAFFGCSDGGRLIACCSVSVVFSTFNYEKAGVFEDFYIVPEYRHKGIARKLARYAFEHSGVSSMTVGCADCDLGLYSAIGFSEKIGNLLAYATD